ncbi:hypothetical protein HT105_25555, partial [Bacteroides fragilis]|nr:hypothetical protein [Bacteroides fragilis]
VDVAKNLVHGTGLPRYSAVCMLAGYFWLALAGVRVDVAKNLVHGTGLPRYSAVCMLAGYFWLALAGV